MATRAWKNWIIEELPGLHNAWRVKGGLGRPALIRGLLPAESCINAIMQVVHKTSKHIYVYLLVVGRLLLK